MKNLCAQGPEYRASSAQAEEPEGGRGEAGAALLRQGGHGAVQTHHSSTVDAQSARQKCSKVPYTPFLNNFVQTTCMT
jgi:hypothetical protein